MEYIFIVSIAIITWSVGSTLGAQKSVPCPKSCLESDGLVCGSDGQVYASECDLRMKNCGKSVNVVSKEECLAGRASMCERECSNEFQPVCGTDGYVYNNTCRLETETCRKGVKMAHYGVCNDLREDEICPSHCNEPKEDDGPVCGSNGNVYRSECEMRQKTCGERVVVASLKYCKLTKNCLKDCVRTTLGPVCGSDGKIYDNDCHMRQKNCGKHIYEIPMVYCLAPSPEESNCPTDCSGVNNTLVCGSDDKVYKNECEMQLLTCGQHQRVEPVNMTECQSKVDRCNRRKCSASYDPVCGTDGVTYNNMCRLSLAQCLRGIRAAHLGVCHDHFVPEVCPDSCPTPIVGQDDPVCGSDGNVYSSACELKRITCGQRVTPLHWKHCPTTAHCYDVCSNISRPVCGSDGNLYKSLCHLHSKNCGKHVYMVPLHYCLRRVFKGCFDICPITLDSVCGTDTKTYSNLCFLRIETCRSKGKIQLAYKGQCGSAPEQIQKIKRTLI